jgi:hypothetical protein
MAKQAKKAAPKKAAKKKAAKKKAVKKVQTPVVPPVTPPVVPPVVSGETPAVVPPVTPPVVPPVVSGETPAVVPPVKEKKKRRAPQKPLKFTDKMKEEINAEIAVAQKGVKQSYQRNNIARAIWSRKKKELLRKK